MSLKIGRVLGSILLGSLLFANYSSAQQISQAEVLSHRVVESLHGFNRDWRTADRTKFKGLVLSLKIDFTPETKQILSSFFTLTFKSEGEIQKASCLGVTLGPHQTPPKSEKDESEWMINDIKKGEAYLWSVGEKCCTIYISVLFSPLPNDINEVTLLYREKNLIKSVAIKREK